MRKSNLVGGLSDINHKKTEGESTQSPKQRQIHSLRKSKGGGSVTVAKQRNRRRLGIQAGSHCMGSCNYVSNLGYPKHIRNTLTVVFKKTSTFILSRKIT